MSEPTVAVVYDSDGREHFAASSSKFVVKGLATGALTREPPPEPEQPGDSDENQGQGEEVSNGPEVPPAGNGPKPGRQHRSGSSDKAADSSTTD